MRLFILVLTVLLTVSSFAQQRVVHNGEACYLHVVEKGNTLYGISKQYAVTIPNIIQANPSAKLGLSIGQKVYIPVEDVNRRAARKSPKLKGNVLVHRVAKGETLYSLSKKYLVDINAILEANPNVKGDGLKKGQLIQIPTIQAKTAKTFVTPAAQDSLIHHDIIIGETLYNLSKIYDITIDSIRNVNGGLKEGLRAGMTLRIPIFRDGYTSHANLNPIARDSITSELASDPRLNMKIGLLLPFSLGSADSSGTVIPREKDDIMKLTDIAYEFYRGVQLGLEELSLYGLNAEVVVLDVTGEKRTLEKCLATSKLQDMDLIIGPLHKDAFESVSSDGRLSKVFRTSPLSSNVNVNSNSDSKVSKLKPTDVALMKAMVASIKNRKSYANVILLSGEYKSWDRQFKQVWMEEDSSPLVDSLLMLKEVEWDKNAQQRLKAAMTMDGENIIVFPVDHRPSITDLISKLATSEFRDMEITLYGTEQWMRLDNLDADVLERVHLHVPSSKFIDWESKETVEFIQQFKDEFGTIPSSSAYGLIAYDLVKFYVQGMMMYGEGFLENQNQLPYTGLATGYRMKKIDNGGWLNEFGYMLKYEGHQFKRVGN